MAGLLPSPPRFAVEHAPSSVEIVVLDEKPVREDKIRQERILLTLDPSPETERAFQKEEKPRPRRESSKSFAGQDSRPIPARRTKRGPVFFRHLLNFQNSLLSTSFTVSGFLL